MAYMCSCVNPHCVFDASWVEEEVARIVESGCSKKKLKMDLTSLNNQHNMSPCKKKAKIQAIHEVLGNDGVEEETSVRVSDHPSQLTDHIKCEKSHFDARVSAKFLRLVKSAEKRGKEFDLTFQDVKSIMKRKTCYYTGIRLTECGNGDTPKATDRTVERIDPDKGYVRGNVVAVCHAANKIKNLTMELETSDMNIGIKALARFVKTVNK